MNTLAHNRPFYWTLKVVAGLTLFCFLVSCSHSNPLHPSQNEVVQQGFYIYVLPENAMAQHGWSEDITIWSFDRHCQGLTATETANPLRISYSDPTADPPREDLPRQSSFSIQLGPWPPPWLYGEQIWTEIDLQLDYADTETAEYRQRNPQGVYVIFRDVFGFWIYIDSQLPLTETLFLVNQLEYVGPPPDDVTNPWDCR